MKQLFLLLLLTISIDAFSQKEILDSFEEVRTKNIPELGKNLCTPDYWNADSDGGVSTFKQLCSLPDKLEMKLYEEQKKENRAVLIIDIYDGAIARDRVYMFLDKTSDSWLIDGFNETEGLVKPFLEGYLTGHFTPYDLPIDMELKDFGDKIVSFGRNSDDMLNWLKEKTAPGSNLDFTSKMTKDMNFEQHKVNIFGYNKRLRKGYIHFIGKHKSEEHYYNSDITIYLSKTENGRIKILNIDYSSPSTGNFFSNK